MFDLRAWLRRAPKPKRLRIKTVDGEERVIELSGNRYLWNEIANTVRTSEAVLVECLDEDGAILRAMRLVDDEPAYGDKGEDKSMTRAMQQQAAMLDRYGLRLREAFDAGAHAAGQSQDKLVELVEVLTNHLAIAVTNINNLSVNLSNALQAAGQADDGENPNGKLLAGFLQLAMGKGLAMPPPAETQTPPNGKGKKHP